VRTPEEGRAVIAEPGVPLCHIACPARLPGHVCQLWVKPSTDSLWTNHGTADEPTIEPSYNCVGGCGWHGYIVDGKLFDAPAKPAPAMPISTLHICANCAHPEILTTVLTPREGGRLQVVMERTVVRAPGIK
jgi:hypothetical protein